MKLKRTRRVKYVGVPFAGAELSANYGDVVAVPLAVAEQWIRDGRAEPTDLPLGPTVARHYDVWPCPRCTWLNSEYMPVCERCGRRLR